MPTKSNQPAATAEANDSRPASDKAVVCKELLGIGSIIWMFDSNRRVYSKESRGGPIYREHWRPTKITGETSRSWVTDFWGKNVPKKGPHPGVALTAEEMEDDVWMNSHRYPIAELVQRLRNTETLRAVAKLVGYDA